MEARTVPVPNKSFSSAKDEFLNLFDSVSNSGDSPQDFAKWVDFKMAQFKVHGKMLREEPQDFMDWMSMKTDESDKAQRTAKVTPLVICDKDKTSENTIDGMSDISDEAINKRKRRRPNRHQPDRLASPLAPSEAGSSGTDEPPNHGHPLTPTHDAEPPQLVICEEKNSDVDGTRVSETVSRIPSPADKSSDTTDNTAFVCPECSISFKSCKDLDFHIQTKHGSPDVKVDNTAFQPFPAIPFANPLVNPYVEMLRSLSIPMVNPMSSLSPTPVEFAQMLNVMYQQQSPQQTAIVTPRVSRKDKPEKCKSSEKSTRLFKMAPTKCPDCESLFSDVDVFRKHMQTCHNHPGFIKLKNSDHTHTYMCKLCGKSFQSYGSTWRHINGVHFRAHKPCVGCSKAIPINSPIRLHYKVCPSLSEEQRALLISEDKR